MDNGSERLSAGPNGAQSSPRHGGVPAVHHSRHAAVPAALKQSFNSMGLLKALRRRWLVAFLVGVLCAAGAATGAWYLIPPTKATAFTLLHVHATSPSILFPNAAGQGTPLDIYTRTQSALVRSQMVLGKALEQLPRLSVLEEQSNKIEWLASEIEVDFKTSPEIMRISMSGERPEELAKIVDAVREAYLKEIVFKDSDQRKRRLKDLNNLLESYNGRLDARRKELKALIDGGASTNAKAMALREEGAVQQLHAERQDLLQVQRKLRTARYELSRVLPAMRDPRCVAVSVVLNMTPGIGLPGSLPWGGLGQTLLAEQPAHEEKTAPPVPEALVDAYLKTDPEGAQLLRHEATLTDWIARASEQAVNQNLDYIQERKRQLSETRKQLDALRAKYRPLLGSRISGKAVEDDQAKVAQLQSEIRMWESMEKGLAAEIAQQEGNLHDTSRKSFDLDSIKDQIATTEKMANRINDEFQKLTVERDAPARVRKLQDATITQPLDAEKQQIKKAAMAGVGAFAAVLFAFGWFEFRKRRIDTPDEVLETLGIKVVGSLPAMPGRRLIGRRSAAGMWSSHMTESVNTTRTMLLHAAAAEGLRVVMVTSAMAGEGKTSLAGHLAISLARAGKRTLLMDCDLRRSALHELFSLPQEPGVSELLRDDTMPVQSAIQPTPVPGLALIAAGAWDPTVSEALAQDKLRGIMQPLREQYDFIIVDSAPILPVVDSLLVARHVDACLFSLLRDVSRLHSIHAADQRLATLGIRVLGAVVNGASGGVYGSYSTSYYASSYSR